MGRVSIQTSKNRGIISTEKILDLIVFIFILALFIFENATYSSLFSVIQLLFVGAVMFAALQRRRIAGMPIFFWLGAFLVLVFALEMIHMNEEGQSALSIVVKNTIRCACVSLYLSFKPEKNVKKVIEYVAFSGLACAIVLLSEFLAVGMDYSDLRYASSQRLGAEIAGGNVNIVAMNMCFAFSAWLYMVRIAQSKKTKVLCTVCMVAIAGISLLTGTRKMLLFYVVVCIVNAVLQGKGSIRRAWIALVFLLVGYYCLLNIEPLYYMIGHKIDFWSNRDAVSMYDASDALRENLITNGMKLFFDNPVFGVGFGRTSYYIGNYAHNNFVEILASGGIVGGVVYYALYVYIIYVSNRYRKYNKEALFVFSSIIGVITIEYFQVTYLYSVPWVFFAVAMVYCYGMRARGATRRN